MWGEGGRRGRNWRDEDLDRALSLREHEQERARHAERAKRLKEGKLREVEEIKRAARAKHDALLREKERKHV